MLVREHAGDAPGRSLALEGLLKLVLANASRLSFRRTTSPQVAAGSHRRIVARFRELIEVAYRQGWSLADYAAALKVSESRLRAACFRAAEQSPMQMVQA